MKIFGFINRVNQRQMRANAKIAAAQGEDEDNPANKVFEHLQTENNSDTGPDENQINDAKETSKPIEGWNKDKTSRKDQNETPPLLNSSIPADETAHASQTTS